MKILIAEDDPGFTTLLSRMLSNPDVQQIAVKSLAELREVFKNPPFPNLVSLDLVLTDCDREQALDEIQHIKTMSPLTKVIVISGTMPQHDLEKAGRLHGADASLAKPVTRQGLAETLRAAFCNADSECTLNAVEQLVKQLDTGSVL